MSGHTNEAFSAWKSAEAAARETERRLASAWQQFERTLKDPPGDELFAELRQRKALASERLADALKVLNPGGR